MPAHLSPDAAAAISKPDELRLLNRSPHPYHHQSSELPQLSDRFELRRGTTTGLDGGNDDRASATKAKLAASLNGHATTNLNFSKESTPASESGTEADDEHFLKGLPAPRPKWHKGLRGVNEPVSNTGSPLPSPLILPQDSNRHNDGLKPLEEKRRLIDVLRRNKNLVRRITEAGLVTLLGGLVASNPQVKPLVSAWSHELTTSGMLYAALLALYPVRVAIWNRRQPKSSRPIHSHLSSNFDPAPLLYPPAITLLTAFLVAPNTPSVILPNIILALSSLPQQLIPTIDRFAPYDVLHWLAACLPVILSSPQRRGAELYTTIPPETLILLYPVHQALCGVLHHLTTTSLLTSELQLLSIGLINVLILAISPQVQILKSLLWVGGLSILVSCSTVIRSGITMARVPKWRFRPATITPKTSFWGNIYYNITWRKVEQKLLGASFDDTAYDTLQTSDGEDGAPLSKTLSRVRTLGPDSDRRTEVDPSPSSPDNAQASVLSRRHTLPPPESTPAKSNTHTPSGRRKRATSISVRPFLKLTYQQAVIRKWCYAIYVYGCMVATIAVSIRFYIQQYALHGEEPIGWGLGYAFGELPWFRFQVVKANLERWICLPARPDENDSPQCGMGTVQHIRHNDFGESNTRLIITGYWLLIFIVGLLIVFRLKDIYEVDTRRKVFHFMMVGMLLPATFIDPTYAALVLSLVLAIFLILDLLRASQLPPLSKPIATFLAPYVDGRDFRGPVVISHIFLLIGCAIPLWLALAALPRTGDGYLAGWEVPTRDVSMVAGVVCVGLGDAAASLIGRRYGHRKWLWGGGKSIEGSVAFAVAVFVGLGVASTWLRVGGWPKSGDETSALIYARDTAFCASMASVTEAVLTGGNDNVIVPVVLWTCVKSLGV